MEVGDGKGDKDNDVYVFDSAQRGLAVIINNENFSGSKKYPDRPGSSNDASDLQSSFEHLGFHVRRFDNLTNSKMVQELRKAATDYDHKNADCFVCAILTHGEQTWIDRECDRMVVRQDLLFGTNGRPVTTRVVVDLFNDDVSPGLKGKPRLFFLQACRGTKLDKGQDIQVKTKNRENDQDIRVAPDRPAMRDSKSEGGSEKGMKESKAKPTPSEGQAWNDMVDPPTLASDDEDENIGVSVSPAPLYKDCLVMYATPPGYFAWRRLTGSPFIKYLCEVLERENLGNVSLMRALTWVNASVARDYQSSTEEPCLNAKKEMPVIESMLVKDVFLSRKI